MLDEAIGVACKAIGVIFATLLIIAVVGALLNVIVFGCIWKLLGG